MNITRYLPVIAFVFFAALMARSLFLNPHHVPSNLVGKAVPNFNLPDMHGNTHNQAVLKKGKSLVVFWASWCHSCLEEHAVLQSLAEQNQDINFIGFNYKDSIVNAGNFLAKVGSPYKYNLIDATGRSSLKWGIRGTPEIFLVENGVVKHKHSGPIDFDIWEREFKFL